LFVDKIKKAENANLNLDASFALLGADNVEKSSD